jgi:hypothetical protein
MPEGHVPLLSVPGGGRLKLLRFLALAAGWAFLVNALLSPPPPPKLPFPFLVSSRSFLKPRTSWV